MKTKFNKTGKNNFFNIGILIKKNLEFTFLLFTALTVIMLVQIFNYIKDQKKNHFFDTLNNLYFEKTLHSTISNLNPKFVDIEHKVLQGENFTGILEKYEVSKKEIEKIRKVLSNKENLKNLKNGQIIKFTLDLGSSNKIFDLYYPSSRTKKIKLSKDLKSGNFKYEEVI